MNEYQWQVRDTKAKETYLGDADSKEAAMIAVEELTKRSQFDHLMWNATVKCPGTKHRPEGISFAYELRSRHPIRHQWRPVA